MDPVAELLHELDQVAAAHEFTRWLDRRLAIFDERDMLLAAIEGGFLLLCCQARWMMALRSRSTMAITSAVA